MIASGKRESLRSIFETVITTSESSPIIQQEVSDHLASHSKGMTAKHANMLEWDKEELANQRCYGDYNAVNIQQYLMASYNHLGNHHNSEKIVAASDELQVLKYADTAAQESI